jgi:hypothetical protein
VKELKNDVNMKADDIIFNARQEIKKFIIYELGLLYSAKGWQDEAYNDFGDMTYEFDGFFIDVDVTDCEGNYYTEKRAVDTLVVNEKEDTFFIELADEDERELYFSDLDTNTLVRIADCIEYHYKEAIGKEDF